MEHTARPALTPTKPRTGLRPYLTAGVAVLGAGMIAATPTVAPDLEATLQQRAVELVYNPVLTGPIQTWIDAFTRASSNLQTLAHDYMQIPAPVLQQVLANWVEYASQYVGNLQDFVSAALPYYFTDGPHSVWNYLESAVNAFMSGNLVDGFGYLWNFISPPLFAFDLVKELYIPGYLLQNAADGYNSVFGPGGTFVGFAGQALTGWEPHVFYALGYGLQTAFDEWNAGDPLGALTNVINLPGLMVDYALNGYARFFTGGMFSTPFDSPFGHFSTGMFNDLMTIVIPDLATAIRAPGAQPIESGGSLVTAIQELINQLFTGWPSLSETFGSGPAAASAAADFGLILPAASTISADLVSAADLGGLSSLSVLPADVAGMLGGLGGDLASVFNPAALLGMLPF